jgi:hypothetical protein
MKVRLHSAGEASPLAVLLLPPILPDILGFSVVAPCDQGASPSSVQRRDFHHGLKADQGTCRRVATRTRSATSLRDQPPFTAVSGVSRQ